MKAKEVEFKYDAKNIKLEEFKTFCAHRKPSSQVVASGFDYFYSDKKDSESFCRHRIGSDTNQLTFKRKTSDANSYVRTEHNINLDRNMSQEQIKAFCSEFGYEYNTSLFKTCFVYIYEDYSLCYYVCYDSNMVEKRRFVEIEMHEDYPWSTEQEAWNALVALERICKPLGVSAQARVKLSLFELFRVT